MDLSLSGASSQGKGRDSCSPPEEGARYLLEGSDKTLRPLSPIGKGKKPTVVVAALARELAGFEWANRARDEN
jgi:hypothetical protein